MTYSETPSHRLITAAWELGGNSGTVDVAALRERSGLDDAEFAAALQAHIDSNHLHIDPHGDEDGTVAVHNYRGLTCLIARVTVHL